MTFPAIDVAGELERMDTERPDLARRLDQEAAMRRQALDICPELLAGGWVSPAKELTAKERRAGLREAVHAWRRRTPWRRLPPGLLAYLAPLFARRFVGIYVPFWVARDRARRMAGRIPGHPREEATNA